MTLRLPTLAQLLQFGPADRITVLEAAQRQIHEEIAALKAGRLPIRDERPLRYYLRLCDIRLRRLAKLARDAGHDEVVNDRAGAV